MSTEEEFSLLLHKNYLIQPDYDVSDAILNYVNLTKELVFHYNENVIKNDISSFINCKKKD